MAILERVQYCGMEKMEDVIPFSIITLFNLPMTPPGMGEGSIYWNGDYGLSCIL